MENRQAKHTSKNKWLIYLMWLVIGVIALRLLGFVSYKIIVPKPAHALSYFQNAIISTSDYYTTISFGTFGEQFITNTVFTILLWFTVIVVFYIFKKLIKSFPYDKASNVIYYLLISLWIYTCLAIFFVPQRKANFSHDKKSVIIEEYNAVLSIWAWPFPENVNEIPFDEIISFKYGTHDNWTLGTSHDMIGLYMCTNSDTIMIGRRMTNHGEFGWLDISKIFYKSAEQEGNAAVDYLNDLIINKEKIPQ